jgi:hypothetical protein
MRIPHFVPAALVAALAVGLLGAGAASAGPGDFTTPDAAAIRPGVQTITDAGQCTANFVFSQGEEVYLGQAAHCSGQGASTATNGCDQEADPLPIGSPVEIVGFDGESYQGTLAYSSWNTMIGNGESDGNTCSYNDFALVRVDPADHDVVNPSMPYWGGPTGTRPSGASSSGAVYTYGNSGLRGGVSTLSPKSGQSLGTSAGGWTHTIYTATPGIPGDSGSGVLDSSGRALGVLVTVAIAPLAGSNGVSDLGRVVDYARAHGMPNLLVHSGDQPFNPRAATLGLPLPI